MSDRFNHGQGTGWTAPGYHPDDPSRRVLPSHFVVTLSPPSYRLYDDLGDAWGEVAACGKRSLVMYRPTLFTRPGEGGACLQCLEAHPVPGFLQPEPRIGDADPQPASSAVTQRPRAGLTPAKSEDEKSRGGPPWVALGLAGVTAAVVFAVAVPIAWVGLGVLAGAVYFGNPQMEALWTGPLGPLLHGGSSVIAALVAALVAAQAVRSARGD